jgi:arabinose-5-phosphate isomerase
MVNGRLTATRRTALARRMQSAKSGAKSSAMLQNRPSPVRSALRTIELERLGLLALEDGVRSNEDGGLGAAFSEAVRIIMGSPGRVIVTGIGKSGHVARKIAATLASTGQPATFVHPTEASHGDLGMVQSGDIVLALSWSGETIELADIVTYAKRYAIPLVAMTSAPESTLAREADVCLLLPVTQEACPNGLAPTTSTTVQLALGDALAIAMLESRGFTAHDFRVFHPGGKLGAKLAYVRDLMHKGDRIPRILSSGRMAEAIVEMTSKGFGCVGVFDSEGALVGIITDGDLRRHLRSDFHVDTPVTAVMTRTPRTVPPDTLVAEALEIISHKISALLVVEHGKVVGIVHFHDLLRVGAV